jgi:O-antigen ligase
VLVPLALLLPPRVAISGVSTPVIAFLGVAGVAAVRGLDPLYAWIGTPDRHFGWLTWLLCAGALVVGRGLDQRAARWLGTVCAVAIGAAGAWAALELLGCHPIALVDAGTRPVGPLGSSAFLGAAAALLGPVVAAHAAATRSRPYAVATALAGVALIASGARAAWVGVLVAGIVFVVVRRPGRRALGALAICVVAAVGMAVAFGVGGRVGALASQRDGGMRGRLDEWRVAARVVRAHPVLGVGPEGYRIAFAKAVDTRYERAHGRDPLPDRAHSAVLDIAATTGLLGLAAYVAILVTIGRRVARAGNIGIALGLLAYLVQSLFLFPLSELDPIAWLLAGLVIPELPCK